MFRVTIISLFTTFIFHSTFPQSALLYAKTIRQERYEIKRRSRLSNNSTDNPEKLSSTKKKSPHSSRSRRKSAPASQIVLLENFSFSLPCSWQQITEKTEIPEKLEAVCIGPGGYNLTPTVTVAYEQTQLTSKEYLDEILSYHSQEENSIHCTLFTTIESQEGPFNVLKVEKITNFGEVALLQAVLIKKNSVYIFTGTSLKEHVEILSKTFVQCVNTFKVALVNQGINHSQDRVEETILKAFEAYQADHPALTGDS